MSKVFVIPDVHLKPWMFDVATDQIEAGDYDRIVMLGDLVDDWNHEKDFDLYTETFHRTYEFLKKYPDTIYCIGNHDISYLYQAYETGYSPDARDLVVEGMNHIFNMLPEGNSAFIHRIDQVLFSHAGLTEQFVRRCFGGGPILEIDEMIARINQFQQDRIWRDDSVVWARPQYGSLRMYPVYWMQVVGHTPVEAPLSDNHGKLLTLDTFSTYEDGKPIGNEKFVWVDTQTEEWGIIDDRQ